MRIDLRDVRTKLLLIIAVLVLLDLAAIAVLLSPAGRSHAAHQERYRQLQQEKAEKAKEVLPTEDMAQKIATAREQEAQFTRERMTARYSAMSEALAHIADEAGVKVSNVKYDEHPGKDTPKGFDSVGITMQVHGSYSQDMRFINAVERQKMLLLIDAVGFSGMEGDQLTVSVQMSTYMRSEA